MLAVETNELPEATHTHTHRHTHTKFVELEHSLSPTVCEWFAVRQQSRRLWVFAKVVIAFAWINVAAG